MRDFQQIQAHGGRRDVMINASYQRHYCVILSLLTKAKAFNAPPVSDWSLELIHQDQAQERTDDASVCVRLVCVSFSTPVNKQLIVKEHLCYGDRVKTNKKVSG